MSSGPKKKSLNVTFLFLPILSSDPTELKEAVRRGCLGKHGTAKQEGTDGCT